MAGVRIAEITDGTSSTLAMGDAAAGNLAFPVRDVKNPGATVPGARLIQSWSAANVGDSAAGYAGRYYGSVFAVTAQYGLASNPRDEPSHRVAKARCRCGELRCKRGLVARELPLARLLIEVLLRHLGDPPTPRFSEGCPRAKIAAPGGIVRRMADPDEEMSVRAHALECAGADRRWRVVNARQPRPRTS